MNGMALYIVGALIALVLLLNSAATYVVFNTYFEVKERRRYQTLFIWLVPLVGAMLAIYVNREDYFQQNNNKQIGNNTAFDDSDVTTHYVAGDDHGGR